MEDLEGHYKKIIFQLEMNPFENIIQQYNKKIKGFKK